ncbi:MAG: flagellar brake protein [Candidatus Accumulibacter sp.]|jgi:c-di-GMP-binding flagellar brake protein YcgR|nr:flagellar brake protein [Accumulibacter sp.]
MVNDTMQDPSPSCDSPFEIESGDSKYNRYFLYSRTEILAILRSIIQKGTLITVHFGHARSFILTSMIDMLPGNAEFIFDPGSDETMNARIISADKLIFTTRVDKVHIQFSTKGARQTTYQGRAAFVGAVPDKLLRLQRREFFRLSTPVVNPIRLRMTPGPNERVVDIPVLDISGGGVGLIFPVDLAGLLEKGRIFENCGITLPGEGLLVVRLCVRNMFDVTNRGGLRYVRVGCEFVDLSAASLSSVQRYIIHVERERKARLSGLS